MGGRVRRRRARARGVRDKAEFLAERLPCNEVRLLDTGHFAWEDGADEWGAVVLSWIDDRYRSLEASAPAISLTEGLVRAPSCGCSKSVTTGLLSSRRPTRFG